MDITLILVLIRFYRTKKNEKNKILIFLWKIVNDTRILNPIDLINCCSAFDNSEG